MKKILVFGASNSRQSINKKLATYAASLLQELEYTLIDLNDFDMPMFGVDLEKAEGFPDKAVEMKALIKDHDGLLISLAEHNGAYTAVFKNIFDWLSRMEGSAWEDKPMLLLSTSPGRRGGASVMEIASNRFPWNGGKVIATFSLPSFGDNFAEGNGITDQKLDANLREQVNLFENHILESND